MAYNIRDLGYFQIYYYKKCYEFLDRDTSMVVTRKKGGWGSEG